MRIVAISGKMRSGKTFVADLMAADYGYERVSFARRLKDDVTEMGFPRWALHEKPPWMRQLLQTYGAARRAVDKDHWVKPVIETLENRRVQGELFGSLKGIVIDDLRYPNEVFALRQYAENTPGVELEVVRLDRALYPRAHMAGALDESETALDQYGEFDRLFAVESGDLARLAEMATVLSVFPRVQ